MKTVEFDAISAAQPLLDAWHNGNRPTTGLTPKPCTTTQAYAIQNAVMTSLGDQGGVWKMALLDGKTREAAVIPHQVLYQSGANPQLPDDGAIEVETALILSGEPDATNPMAAIADIRLAFELVASRLSPLAQPTSLEIMADSFQSAGVILGDSIPDWQNGLPDQIGITLKLDDVTVDASEVVAPLQDALDFLVWLAEHARSQGRALKAGDVIITGARVGPLQLNGAKTANASAMGASVNLG
jgi:2-keto-4-pentenoate hydratase